MPKDLSGAAGLARGLSNESQPGESPSATIQRQSEVIEQLTAMLTTIGGVTHDLNNRLTGILGFSQLLQDCQATETARKHVTMLEEEARRFGEIVGSLTIFARPPKPGKTPVQICDVVERTLKLHADSLRRSRLVVDYVREPNLPEVFAQPQLLMVILLNLIMSLEQEVREKRRPGKMEIRLGNEGHAVWVTISDDQIAGDTAAGHPVIVGLNVCEAVLRDLNGTLEVTRTPAGASLLKINLPAAPAP